MAGHRGSLTGTDLPRPGWIGGMDDALERRLDAVLALLGLNVLLPVGIAFTVTRATAVGALRSRASWSPTGLRTAERTVVNRSTAHVEAA